MMAEFKFGITCQKVEFFVSGSCKKPLDERARVAVRVLLVEDEGIIRVVTAEALEDAGFEVVEARDSDEAIERLADSAPFDAIFTDVQMPGRSDGIALAAHVRRLYPDIPVLVASGDCGNISTRIAALRPPATFFSKPYIADEVVGALKRVTSPT